MKKHHYLKRLDRIQDGLRPPTDDKATVMFYTLFGVPDLDRATSRARKTGATRVMFVPANDSAVQFVSCDQTDHVTPGVAVAFEIAEPSVTVAHRPFLHCTEAQLRQMISLTEAAPDAVAGGNESVSLVRGGKVDFKFSSRPKNFREPYSHLFIAGIRPQARYQFLLRRHSVQIGISLNLLIDYKFSHFVTVRPFAGSLGFNLFKHSLRNTRGG